MLVEIDIFICSSIYFQSMKLEIGSQYTYYDHDYRRGKYFVEFAESHILSKRSGF